MAIRPDFDIGTITLSSGSSDFTTSGSALEVAKVSAGDAVITPSGHVLIIATITGQNSGTLFLPCPAAAAGTGLPLRIRFQPDGSRYQGAVRNLIDLLSSGNLEAFAALVGTAGMVPIFTGPGTLDLVDPITFGVQDPNGSLQSIAGVSGVQNYGKSLLTLSSVQSARASIGASRPAFRAAVTANRPIGNGASDVELWAIPLNVGNHWNGLRFLVPETGIYYFHWQAQFTDGQNNTGYCIPWIKVNGSNTLSTVASKGLFFFPVSVSGVLSLTAGDTVTFALENDGLAGSPNLQGTRTFATGVLIG